MRFRTARICVLWHPLRRASLRRTGSAGIRTVGVELSNCLCRSVPDLHFAWCRDVNPLSSAAARSHQPASLSPRLSLSVCLSVCLSMSVCFYLSVSPSLLISFSLPFPPLSLLSSLSLSHPLFHPISQPKDTNTRALSSHDTKLASRAGCSGEPGGDVYSGRRTLATLTLNVLHYTILHELCRCGLKDMRGSQSFVSQETGSLFFIPCLQ